MSQRYVVAANTQVSHEGRVYGAGEEVSLPDEEAAPLVASGTVEPKPKAKAKRA